MPRAKNDESDLTAVRADIADLVKSIGRLESEISATRALVSSKNGNGASGSNGGHGHHIAEELMAGAAKLGGEATHMAGDTVHAGVTWIDDLLRRNPMPVVITALGIGFVLGVIGRR